MTFNLKSSTLQVHPPYKIDSPRPNRCQCCFFFFFFFFLLFVKQVTCPSPPPPPCARGLFLPQGHNLNTHVKGPLGNVTYQISKAYALHFQTRFFQFVSYISVCKTCRPQGGAIFGPRAIIWKKIGRVSLVEALYQISKIRAFWFQIRRMLMVFSIYVKHVSPRTGPFLAPEQ